MQQPDRSTQFSSRLVGQYALVTGASQGIGRAIAVRFAEATDALSGLSAAEGAHLAALLKKLGRTLGSPAAEGTGER